MKIAFFGDIHGQVFHLLATVLRWQREAGKQLDYIVQVGDFGAFPTLASLQQDPAAWRFAQRNPAEMDFSRLLGVTEDHLADTLRKVRQELTHPIYFIRGNHDDRAWLAGQGSQAVDSFDLFHYVPDGAILEWNGLRVGFLGGIEQPEQRPQDAFDETAYDNFMLLKPGQLDVLVTHEPPYGVSTSFKGQVQGSAKITALMETARPAYLIAGHLHHIIGPRRFSATTYFGLNVLFNARHENQRVEPSSLAILDTASNSLEPVSADWLAEITLDSRLEDLL